MKNKQDNIPLNSLGVGSKGMVYTYTKNGWKPILPPEPFCSNCGATLPPKHRLLKNK